MYMYINFQQNLVNGSVIIVHTNVFAKKITSCINLQLPIVFFEMTLSDMHHRKTYKYINFQQNRVSRSVKTCTQICLKKNCKLHKFATCNWNFEKSRLSDMHYPLTDIQANFDINRSIRYQITAIRNYFHRRQTDRQTDRRRVRQQ